MPRKEYVRDGTLSDLPSEVQAQVMNITKMIANTLRDIVNNNPDYTDLKDSRWAMSCVDEFCTKPSPTGQVGSIRVYKKGASNYRCMIQATGHFRNFGYGYIEELLHDAIKYTFINVRPKIRKQYNFTIENENDKENFEGFDIYPPKKVAEAMWNKLEGRETKLMTEAVNTDNLDSDNNENNEIDAKKILGKLTDDIMRSNKQITQNQADIYSTIITNNLLNSWAKGWQKVKILIDPSLKSNTLEFKIPKMSTDFVSRFVDGRETINGLLHRDPVIKIIMAPSIFKTMKNRDDAYYFFRSAITFYNRRVEKYSEIIMQEIMKLNRGLKQLIKTTSLSGLVSYPIQSLFIFDNVNMTNRRTFDVSKSDIETITKFIRGIVTKYASPEKEKKQILEDLKSLIQSLCESCTNTDNLRSIRGLVDGVSSWYEGDFSVAYNYEMEKFYNEQVDVESMKNASHEVKYLEEKFGVKKLKKIPRDIVSYIMIETESIRDANDKMMIASYCLSKLDIVEWYIELIDTGSSKYIVPHNREYLTSVRTQLLACYKKIMDTPIPKADRPIISIPYPDKYQG